MKATDHQVIDLEDALLGAVLVAAERFLYHLKALIPVLLVNTMDSGCREAKWPCGG